MPTSYIPRDHHTVTPYLMVQGASRMIEFLKKAFDAEEKERMDRPDGAVMHAEIKIGDSMIMLGEPMGEHEPTHTSMYLYVKDADAAFRQAIKAGATSMLEPADQFYGDRCGGVKDSFGNLWWLATHKEDVSREELKRRAAAFKK